MRGERHERERQYFYRVHYDAWALRNTNGPGKPGEWVKEVRTEDFCNPTKAYQYGKDMTADAGYLPEPARSERPESFFVTTVDITERVIIERGGADG